VLPLKDQQFMRSAFALSEVDLDPVHVHAELVAGIQRVTVSLTGREQNVDVTNGHFFELRTRGVHVRFLQ
jgi:hypothetical protein